MATIRKRGKRWHVQVRLAHAESKTKSFSLKSEALNWARSTEAAAHDSHSQPAKTSQSITMGQAINRYLVSVSSKKKGYREEKYRLNRLREFPIWGLALHLINAQDITDYRDTRLQQVSPSTVRRELVIIKNLFSVAKNEWGILQGENPFSLVRLPKCSYPRDKRLTQNELSKLLASVGNRTTVPIKLIILFALETGMRRSEILHISKEKVDVENRVLKLPTSKSGKPRVIPLSSNAMQILHKVGYDFNTSPSALRMAWVRTLKKAGIQNLRFHDLRHEAISRFFEKGLNIAEIMQISGHSDVKSLMRYTHPKPADIAKKLDQIPTDISHATVILKNALVDFGRYDSTKPTSKSSVFKSEVEEKFRQKHGFCLMASSSMLIEMASRTNLTADEFIELLGFAFKLGV